MRPVDDAFDEDVIEPVEEAPVVNTRKYVNSYYTYTTKNRRG